MLIQYQPPGPVAQAFHQSNAFVRGLKGPVGSGKSTCCCAEILSRAIEQAPDDGGVRRTRWVVIRNTYPELKSTTIKTWQDWWGEVAPIKWDIPISSTINIGDIGDGTGMHVEVYFLALDRPDDVGKLKSLEVTGAWLNEASEIEKRIFDMATQRVGRFPAKRNGGPTWSGVIMDTNPPDDDHWWYVLAEEEKPSGMEFFNQPGGLMLDRDQASPTVGTFIPNPEAENAQNLPGGYDYYLRQLSGKDENYIRVFLLGEYGTTLDGKPVYPEWNEKFHLSKVPLKPIPGLPIIASLDFGLTPAVTFLQNNPKGQLIVLAEIASEDDGIRQFYQDSILPFVNANYSRYRIEYVGDPAGRGRSQNDKKSVFEELYSMGVVCEAPWTNEFLARREAVAFWMNRAVAGEPAFLVDPSCKLLRKGFNGGYRYERLKTTGPARFKDRPVKDKYSHVQDALQYGCLYLKGDNATPVRARPVRKSSMAGWVK